MRRTLLVLSVVTAALMLAAAASGCLEASLRLAARSVRSAAPLLVAAFAVSGLVQVILSPALVRRWLGRGSGARGYAVAAAAGVLCPGGPYVYYPLLASLRAAGAHNGVLLGFLVAKALLGAEMLVMEVAIVGTHLTGLRLLASWWCVPALPVLYTLYAALAGRRRRELSA